MGLGYSIGEEHGGHDSKKKQEVIIPLVHWRSP
jgi:hypothetical protein